MLRHMITAPATDTTVATAQAMTRELGSKAIGAIASDGYARDR